MAELFIFAVMMGVLLACITFADIAVWAIYRVRGGKGHGKAVGYRSGAQGTRITTNGNRKRGALMNWYDIRIKGKGTIIVKANSSNQAISEAEDRMGVEFSNNDEVTCRYIGEYDPYKKYPEKEKAPSGWWTA